MGDIYLIIVDGRVMAEIKAPTAARARSKAMEEYGLHRLEFTVMHKNYFENNFIKTS